MTKRKIARSKTLAYRASPKRTRKPKKAAVVNTEQPPTDEERAQAEAELRQLHAQELAKAARARKGPPYDITPAEASELLARHRFEGVDEYDLEKCTGALDEIGYEIESVAEGLTHHLHDRPVGTDPRKLADALAAFSRSLGDISIRMMRYAGRLEAYSDVDAGATKGDDMVEAWRKGSLGQPPPDIEVGREGRRFLEGEEVPS